MNFKIRLLLSTILCMIPFTGCSQKTDQAVMFRGNKQHTGIYTTQGVEQFSAVKWTFKTGGKIISSPVISQKTAYFGSSDFFLYAVDITTGQQKWKFDTDGVVTSSPAVCEGLVLFGSFDGLFYAVDAKSGKEKWKFETGGEQLFGAIGLWGLTPKDKMLSDPWDLFISSTVVDGSIVYFGSGDSYIYALNVKTGEEIWKFKTEMGVHSSPAIYNGKLYCGSWDSQVYALDAKTGKKVWQFNTGKDDQYHLYEGVQSSPVIVDSTVYIGSRSAKFFALNSETGEKKWQYETGGPWIPSSASVYKGTVYFGTSDSYLMLALDCVTGKKKWEFNAGAWVFSSPAIVGETIYFGCHNGRLFALDITTGNKKWEFQTDVSKKNVNNYYTDDGKFKIESYTPAPDPNDAYGNYLTQVEDKILSIGAIISSPLVKDGVIYFGSTDGTLYALE